jgi:hypothetical protein
MKITKRQLKRIIKEEKARLLREGAYMHDILAQAGEALRNGNPEGVEEIQREVQGLMLSDDEARNYNSLLEAMVEAAYTIEEFNNMEW